MFKFILIFLLLTYLFIKFSGFILKVMFRMLGGTTNTSKFSNDRKYSPHKKRARGGNVDIEYVPEDQDPSKRKFKGGEYVEYEEVK